MSQICVNNGNIYWENSSENATNGLEGLCTNLVWSYGLINQRKLLFKEIWFLNITYTKHFVIERC